MVYDELLDLAASLSEEHKTSGVLLITLETYEELQNTTSFALGIQDIMGIPVLVVSIDIGGGYCIETDVALRDLADQIVKLRQVVAQYQYSSNSMRMFMEDIARSANRAIREFDETKERRRHELLF
jgi:hypothetical protein